MKGRKWGILLLGAVMSIGLAACGGNGSSNSSPSASTGGSQSSPSASPSQASKDPVTLQYWTSDRHDQEYITEVINKFNETNEDNITVEIKVMSENFDQALDIAFASNQAPDVFRAKGMKNLVSKGYVEPLDDRLTEEMKSKFGSAMVDGKSRFDGKVYSLANGGSTLRLIYNQDLFTAAGVANPPKSLQELVDAAKKITEYGKKDGIYGFALNFKNPMSAFERSIREIMQLSGDHAMGYQHKEGQYDFSNYAKAIEYFKQMHEDGSVLPGSGSLDIDPLRAQFAQGKIGMYLSYSSEPGVYSTQFPTEVKWAAALAPTVDGTIKGASEIIADGNWLSISAKSEHKDAAWTFLQYMYSDDVLVPYHENGLGISVLPHVVAKAKTPDLYGIEGFMPTKYDAMWPVFPWVAPEGPNYADEFYKYMIAGGNLDDIVKDINDRYNAALQKEVEKGTVDATPDPSFDAANLQGQ